MVTAFVTGATGYTGREVVRELVEGGHRAVAHVRPDSSRLDQWRGRFEAQGAEVDDTAWDEAAMAETLRALQPDAVFALVGTTRKRMDRLRAGEADYAVASYEEVDYGLPALLLRACLAAEIRPRYVYLSAVGVKPESSSAYYRARARMEAELQGSGVPYTIARPAIISGGDREEDRPLETMAAVTSDLALSVVGAFGFRGLQRRWSPISGAELARALVRLALDEAAEDTIAEPEQLR